MNGIYFVVQLVKGDGFICNDAWIEHTLTDVAISINQYALEHLGQTAFCRYAHEDDPLTFMESITIGDLAEAVEEDLRLEFLDKCQKISYLYEDISRESNPITRKLILADMVSYYNHFFRRFPNANTELIVISTPEEFMQVADRFGVELNDEETAAVFNPRYTGIKMVFNKIRDKIYSLNGDI